MSRFHLLSAARRFCEDRRGAFAASFVILTAFLFSLAALGFEGSRFLNERARLSDGLEQAALAVVAEDTSTNNMIADAYIDTYMERGAYKENASLVGLPNITMSTGKSEGNDQVSYVEYKVSAQIKEDSWFSSPLFPSFGKTVVIGGSSAARKYRTNMDVMFVVDFSDSMNEGFSGGGIKKVEELKNIVLQISQELLEDNSGNKVGFAPFAWGTKTLGKPDTCSFPYVTKSRLPASPDTLMAHEGDVMYSDINRVIDQIDYQATVENIPNVTHYFEFPYSMVTSEGLCMKLSNATPLLLTSSFDSISGIKEMTTGNLTLINSGMIQGTQLLAKGGAPRKVLVIVSDGTDVPSILDDKNGNYDVSGHLFNAGLCNKIREVLTTPDAIGKIAFIGINYQPTLNWKSCVGVKNYFEATSVNSFEEAMRRAVFEEVGHSSLYDR